MKKIISYLLTAALLLSTFAFTTQAFDYFEGVSATVRYNAEKLYAALVAAREEVLQNDAELGLCIYNPVGEIGMEGIVHFAEILETLGVQKIVEIQQIEVTGSLFSRYFVTVIDAAGNLFVIHFTDGGGISAVLDQNGEIILSTFVSPPIYTPTPWWARLPAWLQWMLRWFFFGCVWMR